MNVKPTPHAEKLVQIARSGEKISSKDRRHCVAYLMATAPEISNVELGAIFQVCEKQIRNDKLKIRKSRANNEKLEDVGLVISDIAMSFERQMQDIERSKKKAKPGTKVFLDHCRALFDLQLRKVQALQDLGYYPKNLGTLTTTSYEYKAIVSKQDGSVEVHQSHLLKKPVDTVDAEFEEVPLKLLEPPVVNDVEDETT
jgi:hypothetical protein